MSGEILLGSVLFKPLMQMKKIMMSKYDSHSSSAIILNFLQLFIHVIVHLENIDWPH